MVFIKKIALLSSPTFAVFMGYVFCSAIITPFAVYRSGRHFRQIGRHWWSFVALGAFAAASTWCGTAAYTMTVSSYVEAVVPHQVEAAANPPSATKLHQCRPTCRKWRPERYSANGVMIAEQNT